MKALHTLILATASILFGCGSEKIHGDSTLNQTSNPNGSAFVCPTFNNPVILQGTVRATSADPNESEYYIQNVNLITYLKTTPTTNADLLQRLKMLNAIVKYGGADGCVAGNAQPAIVNGKLIFEVENGAIAISSGGFSVSN